MWLSRFDSGGWPNNVSDLRPTGVAECHQVTFEGIENGGGKKFIGVHVTKDNYPNLKIVTQAGAWSIGDINGG